MRFWLILLSWAIVFENAVPLFIIDVLLKDLGGIFKSLLRLDKPIKPEIYGGAIDAKKLVTQEYKKLTGFIEKTKVLANKKFGNKLPASLKSKLDQSVKTAKELKKLLDSETTPKNMMRKPKKKRVKAKKPFPSKTPRANKPKNKKKKKNKGGTGNNRKPKLN